MPHEGEQLATTTMKTLTIVGVCVMPEVGLLTGLRVVPVSYVRSNFALTIKKDLARFWSIFVRPAYTV